MQECDCLTDTENAAVLDRNTGKAKVSVITPAYNAERYLVRCVESVLQQTYQNLEMVIVDDGSTDRTAELCDELAERDPRIKVIHQENGGVSSARNIGISKSSGEYLCFLDADDRLTCNALEIMVECLEGAGADIAHFLSCSIEDGAVCTSIESSRKQKVLTGIQALEGALEDRPFSYAVWAKLYRKSFVGNTRFVPGIRVHEDAFFLFECFSKQPKMVLSEKHVHWYTVSPNSASRSIFSDKFLDILKIADLKMQIIRKQYPDFEEKAYNLSVKANMALLSNLCKTWERKYWKVERRCIQAVINNGKYFISATDYDQKWFFIIKYRLYYLYKLLWWIKHILKR